MLTYYHKHSANQTRNQRLYLNRRWIQRCWNIPISKKQLKISNETLKWEKKFSDSINSLIDQPNKSKLQQKIGQKTNSAKTPNPSNKKNSNLIFNPKPCLYFRLWKDAESKKAPEEEKALNTRNFTTKFSEDFSDFSPDFFLFLLFSFTPPPRKRRLTSYI